LWGGEKMKKVAIEQNLTPISKYLTEKGYIVQSINFNNETIKTNSNFDAYVVTGMDSNFLGMHDTSSRAVVIDASGLSPEQVYQELEIRL
jgi:uncharacterized protein YvpB